MNEPAFSEVGAPCRRRFRWGLLFGTLGVLGVLFLASIVALILSFRMGGEARALRNAVFTAAPNQWRRQVEFGVGALPAFAARTASGFFQLDPPVKAGIRAFHGADVGVYERRGYGSSESRQQALARASEVMEERHWDSLVTVQEGRESVQVFVPRAAGSSHHTRVCILVMNDDEMVLVSAQVNLEPLLEMIDDVLPKKFLALRD